ncbi:MAG: histidine phosphatase family protein [Burkholderiales bacterium]|nr:histidine phosphatase family protein [Burkholderiales bacterium]
MQATEIILIRHGETAWNVERRLQGHIDIALNEQGERQAHQLGHALRDEKLEAVISSDLLRARQTAQSIVSDNREARNLSMRLDKDLRERCFGGFEGLTYGELQKRYPVEYAAWKAREIDARLPDGMRKAENFGEFYLRVIQALGRWGARYSGKTIAIVAHGGVLECAYRAALQMPICTPRDFDIFNASINRFTWHDGKLSLRLWGDVEHLHDDSLDELDEQIAA